MNIGNQHPTESPLAFIGQVVKLFIPPVVFKGAHYIQGLFRKPALEYAPDGWQTPLKDGQNIGWSVDSVIETEKAKWDAFCRNLEGAGPLGFSHEHTDLSVIRNPNFHNVHISYAYVLALTAHKKDRISVLEWGGALGHYYLVGKAVMPDVAIDYHVKEVPLMAEAGRQLNPEVHWYDDESCLERDYDLIMMTGCIPYIKDWSELLHRDRVLGQKIPVPVPPARGRTQFVVYRHSTALQFTDAAPAAQSSRVLRGGCGHRTDPDARIRGRRSPLYQGRPGAV